jgi:hypothetical protein
MQQEKERLIQELSIFETRDKITDMTDTFLSKFARTNQLLNTILTKIDDLKINTKSTKPNDALIKFHAEYCPDLPLDSPKVFDLLLEELVKERELQRINLSRIPEKDKYWKTIKQFSKKLGETNLYGLGNCISNVAYFITIDCNKTLAMSYLNCLIQEIDELIENKNLIEEYEPKKTLPKFPEKPKEEFKQKIKHPEETKLDTIPHFSKSRLEEITDEIYDDLKRHCEINEIYVLPKRDKINQLLSDLNNISFKTGDWDRQVLIHKFMGEIAGETEKAGNVSKISWFIYREFKEKILGKYKKRRKKTPIFTGDLQMMRGKVINKSPRINENTLEEVKKHLHDKNKIFALFRKHYPDVKKTTLQQYIRNYYSFLGYKIKLNLKKKILIIKKKDNKKVLPKFPIEQFGEILENDITIWINEKTSYNCEFHHRSVSRLIQVINYGNASVFTANQIITFIVDFFKKDFNCKINMNEIRAHILYLKKSGLLSTPKQGSFRYVVNRNSEIPPRRDKSDYKTVERLREIEELDMKKILDEFGLGA